MTAIITLSVALCLFGAYCHYLLGCISDLEDQNEGMGDMIAAMASELQTLGSPNVFFNQETP